MARPIDGVGCNVVRRKKYRGEGCNGSQRTPHGHHPTQINRLNDEAQDFRAALTKLAPKERAQTVREHGRSVELTR